jgi:hypothetical protein
MVELTPNQIQLVVKTKKIKNKNKGLRLYKKLDEG